MSQTASLSNQRVPGILILKIKWLGCEVITNHQLMPELRMNAAIPLLLPHTLYSQYIFSLILFTVKNKPLFTPNNEIHKYKTRNNTNLHLPTVNITKYYKGPYISGLKAFSHLPRHLKSLANYIKTFKTSLKRFLYHHSFYSIEEYYEYNDDKGT